MDFATVIQTRRSVREYAKREIPVAVLTRILEAGRIAPSAFNRQPWRFVVVRDPTVTSKLAKLSKDQNFVASSSAVVVCCGKKYENPYNWMGEHNFLIDLAIAIDHLTLAARNEGVGSCWIGGFDDAPIKALLDIPADHDVVMLLSLGYPISQEAFQTPAERLPLAQIAFGEKFGKPMA